MRADYSNKRRGANDTQRTKQHNHTLEHRRTD